MIETHSGRGGGAESSKGAAAGFPVGQRRGEAGQGSGEGGAASGRPDPAGPDESHGSQSNGCQATAARQGEACWSLTTVLASDRHASECHARYMTLLGPILQGTTPCKAVLQPSRPQAWFSVTSGMLHPLLWFSGSLVGPSVLQYWCSRQSAQHALMFMRASNAQTSQMEDGKER